MKNKFLTLILIYFIFNSFAFSKDFIFKTKKIEITEKGKFINATDGQAVSDDGDMEISADEFQYNKDKNILNIFIKTFNFYYNSKIKCEKIYKLLDKNDR